MINSQRSHLCSQILFSILIQGDKKCYQFSTHCQGIQCPAFKIIYTVYVHSYYMKAFRRMPMRCYALRRSMPAFVRVSKRSDIDDLGEARACPADLPRNAQIATERRHDGTQAAQTETMSSEAPDVRVRRGPKIVERAKRA